MSKVENIISIIDFSKGDWLELDDDDEKRKRKKETRAKVDSGC